MNIAFVANILTNQKMLSSDHAKIKENACTVIIIWSVNHVHVNTKLIFLTLYELNFQKWGLPFLYVVYCIIMSSLLHSA